MLDTDVITALQNGDVRIAAHVTAIPPGEKVFVMVVALQEQLRGQLAALNSSRTQASSTSLVRTYADLLKTASFYFGQFTVLPYDDAAARKDTQLKAQQWPRNTMDRRIAAIALANQSVLATRNVVHFQGVPGLHVEDWMAL